LKKLVSEPFRVHVAAIENVVPLRIWNIKTVLCFLLRCLFDGLRLRPALFGLSHGLLLRFAATRIFQSILSGTRPLDHLV
jgi:hypothetical protein